MVYACCVSCCGNRPSRKGLMKFYTFPKDKIRCHKWLKSLKLINNEDDEFIGDLTKLTVCSDHFEESDFYMAGMLKKIRKNSVPSITKKISVPFSNKVANERVAALPALASSDGSLTNCNYFTSVSHSDMPPNQESTEESPETSLSRYSLNSHISDINITVMLSGIVGDVKLENTGVTIDKYEMRDNGEGRRWMLFDCSNDIEQYVCKTCPSFRTSFLASLKQHQRNDIVNEDSEENVYKCLKCFFTTHSKYVLLRHCYSSECATEVENEKEKLLIQYQSDQSDLILKNEIPDHQFGSELYGTKSKEKNSLNSHECAQCALKFSQKSTLVRHTKLQHSKPADIQWFTCLHCSFQFKYKGSFNRHIKQRHGRLKDTHTNANK